MEIWGLGLVYFSGYIKEQATLVLIIVTDGQYDMKYTGFR
jgi:hypothetical protein